MERTDGGRNAFQVVGGRVNFDNREGDGVAQTNGNATSPLAVGSVLADDSKATKGGMIIRVKPGFAE